MGRPSDFNQATVDLICAQIADGKSLRKICLDETMPCRATVLDWLEAHEDFQAKHARARARQAECMLEMQLEEVAECTSENANAVRVKVSTYQWIAAKLAPKKYGDRIHTELTGADGGPILTKNADELSDKELESLARAGRAAPTEPEAGAT
jgi:hypothetical protein